MSLQFGAHHYYGFSTDPLYDNDAIRALKTNKENPHRLSLTLKDEHLPNSGDTVLSIMAYTDQGDRLVEKFLKDRGIDFKRMSTVQWFKRFYKSKGHSRKYGKTVAKACISGARAEEKRAAEQESIKAETEAQKNQPLRVDINSPSQGRHLPLREGVTIANQNVRPGIPVYA